MPFKSGLSNWKMIPMIDQIAKSILVLGLCLGSWIPGAAQDRKNVLKVDLWGPIQSSINPLEGNIWRRGSVEWERTILPSQKRFSLSTDLTCVRLYSTAGNDEIAWILLDKFSLSERFRMRFVEINPNSSHPSGLFTEVGIELAYLRSEAAPFRPDLPLIADRMIVVSPVGKAGLNWRISSMISAEFSGEITRFKQATPTQNLIIFFAEASLGFHF